MKLKIQKGKFIRNIIIGVIALIIVAFIINTAPGYKRNKFQNVINLVIGDENVTEKLQKPIYLDENGVVYISKEDIQQLLDKTFYYDAEEKLLIATSEVTVASMKLNEKEIKIDGSVFDTLYQAIEADNTVYVPIKKVETVYNIETSYLETEKIVIIDKLNKGMIKAECDTETDIRFKPRALSKKVGKLEIGQTVSAFYTTSKGWRLIRTEEGIVGYVKANTLTNEYILRKDMEQEVQTQNINISLKDGETIDIDSEKIVIQDLLELTNDGILIKNTETLKSSENTKVWANLKIGDVDLSSFDERTKTVKNIASIARKDDINGINIIADSIDKNVERFIVELAPKLKERGIKANLVINSNNGINTETYTGIVNYLITEVK